MAARRPVALITGASSGIGAAFARLFAAKGHDLALAALPDALLPAMADEIAARGRHPPVVVPVDLTLKDSGLRIANEMAAHGVEPAFIVNCAGFGLVGPAAALNRDQQLAMIDLNVRAVADLSLRFIDSLIRHRGGILNVASVSAFVPSPEMAVYHASKTFVLSLSEALHCELAPHGVRVTTMCSGPVATQFQYRAGIRSKLPRLLACSPEFVAARAYDGLMRGKRVVIPGVGNKVLSVILRLIPRFILLPGQVGAMRFAAKPPAQGFPKLSHWTEPGELPP